MSSDEATFRDEPVFQRVLGDEWHELGNVVRRHFFLRPYSRGHVCVSGEMSEVYHSRIAKILIPFGLLFGAIVPYRGRHVPIDVHYDASPDSRNIYWDRIFRFPNGRVFHFRSFMEPIGEGEVVEFVRFGVGMRLRVTAEDDAIVFRSTGYVWRLFGFFVPVPVQLFFGNAYVEERPAGDDRFTMKMELEHPLLGTLFRYQGAFDLE